MGQNWWFLFWQISVVLTYYLLIQGDIDKEGDFCGKTRLRDLTWFHLGSESLHLSSLIPSGELFVGYLISNGLGIRRKIVLFWCLHWLLALNGSLYSWDYNYPGDNLLLCSKGLESFANSTMQMKRMKITLDSLWKWNVCYFFPVIQAPK